MREDFPTFDLPINENSSPLNSGYSFSRTADFTNSAFFYFQVYLLYLSIIAFIILKPYFKFFSCIIQRILIRYKIPYSFYHFPITFISCCSKLVLLIRIAGNAEIPLIGLNDISIFFLHVGIYSRNISPSCRRY